MRISMVEKMKKKENLINNIYNPISHFILYI